MAPGAAEQKKKKTVFGPQSDMPCPPNIEKRKKSRAGLGLSLCRSAADMVLWIKLGFLAIKQVAKPVAARIKASARTSDTFRKLILAVGQRLHRNTLQLDRIAEGKGAATHVAPLRETVAVERGSDFVAEMVIYTISATVLGAQPAQPRTLCCCGAKLSPPPPCRRRRVLYVSEVEREKGGCRGGGDTAPRREGGARVPAAGRSRDGAVGVGSSDAHPSDRRPSTDAVRVASRCGCC